MKHIYISVDITFYNTLSMKPDCEVWEKIDEGKMTVRKLSLLEAQKLQWELKKFGGRRTYNSNLFNPAIVSCSTTYSWTARE